MLKDPRFQKTNLLRARWQNSAIGCNWATNALLVVLGSPTSYQSQRQLVAVVDHMAEQILRFLLAHDSLFSGMPPDQVGLQPFQPNGSSPDLNQIAKDVVEMQKSIVNTIFGLFSRLWT